jgi:hypothetical protein
MREKPILGAFGPFEWKWMDPFGKQVCFHSLPFWNGTPIATWSRFMMVYLLSCILLVPSHPFLTLFRGLVSHKFRLVVPQLLYGLFWLKSRVRSFLTNSLSNFFFQV